MLNCRSQKSSHLTCISLSKECSQQPKCETETSIMFRTIILWQRHTCCFTYRISEVANIPHVLAKQNAKHAANLQLLCCCVATTLPFVIVLVVSPLNSLIENQARNNNNNSDLKAVVLQVGENIPINVSNGDCDIVFLHPEACFVIQTWSRSTIESMLQ